MVGIEFNTGPSKSATIDWTPGSTFSNDGIIVPTGIVCVVATNVNMSMYWLV